jgi:osmoprotectant transport system permease protein
MNSVLDWARSHAGLLSRTATEHIVLSGSALAIVLAIALPLGIALANRPRLAGPVIGIVNALRTVPSLAVLVLMLPLLGTGFVPSLVALTLYGLPAVLVNTTTGIREVDSDTIEAARGQGLSGRQVMSRIAIPLATPVILAGIRTAAVQIVSAATLAVFIGGGGLGELISSGMGLLDIPQLVAGAAAVALLALATEVAFALVERVVARRYGTAAS